MKELVIVASIITQLGGNVSPLTLGYAMERTGDELSIEEVVVSFDDGVYYTKNWYVNDELVARNKMKF